MLSLYGDLGADNSVVSLNQFQRLHLPNLRHLSLLFYEPCGHLAPQNPLLTFLDNFPAAHSLETLSIRQLVESDVILPLVGHRSIRSLTRLLLDSVEPGIVFQLLEQLPALEHFRWEYDPEEDADPLDMTPPPLALPSLLSIKVFGDVQRLFASLDAPRLVQAQFNTHPALLGSKHRFPALRRLSWRINFDKNHQLSSFLHNHPSLEELFACNLYPMIRKQQLRRLVSSVQSARHLPFAPSPTRTLLLSLSASFTSPDTSQDSAHPSPAPTIDLIRDLKLRISASKEERERARDFLAEGGLKEGDHYTLASRFNVFDNVWPDAFSYWDQSMDADY